LFTKKLIEPGTVSFQGTVITFSILGITCKIVVYQVVCYAFVPPIWGIFSRGVAASYISGLWLLLNLWWNELNRACIFAEWKLVLRYSVENIPR